jgi:hypothetical protein
VAGDVTKYCGLAERRFKLESEARRPRSSETAQRLAVNWFGGSYRLIEQLLKRQMQAGNPRSQHWPVENWLSFARRLVWIWTNFVQNAMVTGTIQKRTLTSRFAHPVAGLATGARFVETARTFGASEPPAIGGCSRRPVAFHCMSINQEDARPITLFAGLRANAAYGKS